ncbi:lipopolysaccharide biosynthesis protein [Nocardioides limicola]|uniref:lipopolysaccharide biosynthesis protein n=1 Tax=Nocardioides limicola TaxID=2803368 RepID=UPI00193BD831|nr:lipopolysaccharide biosynthesis protein [Nocardioides sp. DJM-14]
MTTPPEKSEESAPDAPVVGHMRDRFTFLVVVMGTFGLQGLTLVTGIISARLLGVEGRGQVALVFALGLMLSQVTFGGSLPVAIAKNLAERRLAARDGLRRLARRRGWMLLLPCVLAAVMLLLLERDASGGERYGLAVAVAVMTLQTLVFRMLVGSLQGEIGHLGRMALVAMTPQALFTIALTTAWLAGWQWSALDVLASFFVASLIGVLLGWRALARPTRRVEDELDQGRLFADARHAYVSSVRPIDGIGLDRILVGALLGTFALGLYAAAVAVAFLCSIVGQAVSVITLPRVAMYHDDPEAQRAVIRRWLLLSAALIVVIVLAVQAIVAPAIRIAFGEEFTGAITVARWLVLAVGFLGFRTVLISVLQGQGRGGTASWIELALTPVLVVGVLISAHYESLEGVGVAMLVVGVIACIALGAVVARRQPVRPPSTTST